MIARKYGWRGPRPTNWQAPRFAAVAPTQVDHVDRLTIGISARDQGDEGCCTGFGWARLLQYIGGSQDLLSPQFLYFNARVQEASQDQDAGAAVSDVGVGAMEYGAAKETVYPYVPGQFSQRPTLDAYADGSRWKGALRQPQAVNGLNALLNALAAGHAVVLGFSVPAYFESADMERTGWLPLPGSHERFLGGHCVVADGFDRRDSQKPFVWIANSWSASWGPSDGWFKMPFAWFTDARRLVDDAWTVLPA
jgi:hypothetical protein